MMERSNGGLTGGWSIPVVITRLEQISTLRVQARRDFTEGGVTVEFEVVTGAI